VRTGLQVRGPGSCRLLRSGHEGRQGSCRRWAAVQHYSAGRTGCARAEIDHLGLMAQMCTHTGGNNLLKLVVRRHVRQMHHEVFDMRVLG
jgi:hypothetical protein